MKIWISASFKMDDNFILTDMYFKILIHLKFFAEEMTGIISTNSEIFPRPAAFGVFGISKYSYSKVLIQ